MEVVEANGARIPAIGLGTMTLQDAVCVEAVKTALRLGYRHIDTAERYNNEAAVGEGLHQGLRDAGLKREDVFVTTKVYFDKLAAADFQRSFDESLTKLNCPGSICSSSIGRTRRYRWRKPSASCARPNATGAQSMSGSRISPPPCWKRRPSLRASPW